MHNENLGPLAKLLRLVRQQQPSTKPVWGSSKYRALCDCTGHTPGTQSRFSGEGAQGGRKKGAASVTEPGPRAIGKGGTQGLDGGRALSERKTRFWSSPEMQEREDVDGRWRGGGAGRGGLRPGDMSFRTE